ncbi:MAG: 2-amino-4-hydroxy-6-hydroxymethyldihydropteridine diphosphokinase [Sedimentitalea sp.]|nr:2-amino-4-hydroxy-6-hydroxymethyldihydropteridine diphosphokinase [Sedimentitalea sp.]
MGIVGGSHLFEFRSTGVIALGSNLPFGGDPPQDILRRALAAMPPLGIFILSSSRFFFTPCFPPGAGPDYVNAAVQFGSDLGPQEVLDALHGIEARFGRRRARRWGMRTLDLDLVAMGNLVLPDTATQAAWRALPPAVQAERSPDRLILPHPRLQDRAFVLVPMADIVPDWRHPVLHLTVRQMRDALPAREIDAVRPI